MFGRGLRRCRPLLRIRHALHHLLDDRLHVRLAVLAELPHLLKLLIQRPNLKRILVRGVDATHLLDELMALGEGSLGSHLLRGETLLPRIQTVVGADGDGSVALLPLESRIWSRCSLRVARRSAASSGGRASRCARVSTGFPLSGFKRGADRKNGPNFANNGQPPMLADFVTTPGGFGLGRAGGPGALVRHTRSALRQRRGPIEAIRSARATCVRTFGACEVPNCSNRAGPRVRADAKKSQRSRNVKSADDTKPLILHPVCSTGDGCDR